MTYYNKSIIIQYINFIKELRINNNLSQRKFAERTGLSFRSVQLLEKEGHDPQLSSLIKIGQAFDRPSAFLEETLASFFLESENSLRHATEKIARGGEWRIHLFNFVDGFRKHRDLSLIQSPPSSRSSHRIRALSASIVEALCHEDDLSSPDWCLAISPLKKPWFVSGMENLKALSLVESPVFFRMRNIFVLSNFLERA